MEEQSNDIKKKKRKKLLFWGLGLSAAGVLAFFGIEEAKKWKQKNSDKNNGEDNAPYDTTDRTSMLSPAPIIPSKPKVTDDFPLKKGSKGEKVKALQQALIDKYGKSILP